MEGMAENIPEMMKFPDDKQTLDTKLMKSPSKTTTLAFISILTNSPLDNIDAALSSAGIPSSPTTVEDVLRHSYSTPSAAVKFFRWAGLHHKHSSSSWNLIVDLLAKSNLFEPMWDAIRSMKSENLLSVSTFVSVFRSYCEAGRFGEATMTFDVMERYGVKQDVVAVNGLLSALSNVNQTKKASEFFEKIKGRIPPDAHTFAILLQGWQKEGNASEAMRTFGEMVIRVGWSPLNVAAYDAFLSTLVHASQLDEAIKFLQVMKKQNCLPGFNFFTDAFHVIFKLNDLVRAIILWDIMSGTALVPNFEMYSAMIRLLCAQNDVDKAFRFLDKMVFDGAFPDSGTYNVIFSCLIKNKKVRTAGKFFNEMVKNEWPPTSTNCAAAITMMLECGDPEVAIEIWTYVVENRISPLNESAIAMLTGLCNLGRLSDLRRFAEDILDRRIIIGESTMSKMENAFAKGGRNAREKYDDLRRRWKAY